MLKKLRYFEKNSIDAEIVDLQSLRPLDLNPLIKSIKKTKNALIIDNSIMTYGVSSEIYSKVIENIRFKKLKDFKIKRIGPPDIPIHQLQH